MPDRCSATNQNGKPCSAKPYKDGLCRWHHPDLAAERRDWSAKGGKGKSNESRARKKVTGDLRDLAGVKAMLMDAMEQTKKGDMDPGILTAISTAARAVVVVSRVADFEEQLAQMRADIARFGAQQGAAS